MNLTPCRTRSPAGQRSEVVLGCAILNRMVPLRDRCSFGRFPWLISQALSVTYMAGERRLYLERNYRLPESPAHSRRRNREGPASSKGLNSQRGFGPAVEPRRKSRPRSTSLHGSSPCKCQRLSTLRWDRLPPSRPSTKSGARAGGRRLSDRRLHRWLAGTSASAPSSHGAADLLGLNRAHICVRNQSDGRPRPTSVVSYRQVRILSVGIVRASDDSSNNASSSGGCITGSSGPWWSARYTGRSYG